MPNSPSSANNLTQTGYIGKNIAMSDKKLNIHIPQGKLESLCHHHHIAKLSFFGSVLGNQFGVDSDVDVLVEFDAEHIPGLIEFIGMEMELSDLLGRKADLHTSQSLSHHFRDHVIAEARVQYAA